MSVFSYHLAETNFFKGFIRLIRSPKFTNVPGLIHAEFMTGMTLGAPLFSSSRIIPGQVAFFAQWENEQSIDRFLRENKIGIELSKGWHTRLLFFRQWGVISEFAIDKNPRKSLPQEAPVVAITLARMKLLQVPRFITWGRPAEKLVRDHPGITLALASIRFPRTVSTFSVWKTKREMIEMVHGHNKISEPKRHMKAMKERDRKDFHYQFTTLRFQPFAEYGQWQGQDNIIPNLNHHN